MNCRNGLRVRVRPSRHLTPDHRGRHDVSRRGHEAVQGQLEEGKTLGQKRKTEDNLHCDVKEGREKYVPYSEWEVFLHKTYCANTYMQSIASKIVCIEVSSRADHHLGASNRFVTTRTKVGDNCNRLGLRQSRHSF
jgi:hypothetical protein